MDWEAIIGAIESAAEATESVLGTRVGGLLSSLVSAIPAIEAGVASAEPYIAAGIKLVTSGEAGISDAEWQAQLDALAAQTQTLDNQVAEDQE